MRTIVLQMKKSIQNIALTFNLFLPRFNLQFSATAQWSSVYVYVNASGTTPETFCDGVFTYFQDALNCTCHDITEILAAGGTYYLTQETTERDATFQLKNDLTIYSGLDGTKALLNKCVWQFNVTILSGDINGSEKLAIYSYYSFIGSETNPTTVIDYFTTTMVNTNVGSEASESRAMLYNNNGYPSAMNSSISGNSAYEDRSHLLTPPYGLTDSRYHLI